MSVDHQVIPSSFTSISCVKYNAFWEEVKVENKLVESEVIIDLYITATHQWLAPDDPPLVLGQVQTLAPTFVSATKFSADLLLKPDMVQDLGLNSVLKPLIDRNEISEDQLHNVGRHISSICSEVGTIIKSQKPKETIVSILIEVAHTEWCDVHEYFNATYEHKLVPAAPSSVEALKTMKCDEENLKDPCTVCREEFMIGEDIALMPCLHVFHKDCIGQWLKTTNTCPICRFSMPT
ncbi:E3 ubiquitin-protein ligase ring1-like [Thalictrum thalictroides]|uniref:RING-type E3 ubiquitin transferase n=1 Tax=Thalictrum thalictroides TaxID=46969 RepID=A0A7J6V5N8_THATH|nr:E3 ubiquitin-protein ligase ring1-like [Thalictrum thalictroides]